jgi:hypothetical protein
MKCTILKKGKLDIVENSSYVTEHDPYELYRKQLVHSSTIVFHYHLLVRKFPIQQ